MGEVCVSSEVGMSVREPIVKCQLDVHNNQEWERGSNWCFKIKHTGYIKTHFVSFSIHGMMLTDDAYVSLHKWNMCELGSNSHSVIKYLYAVMQAYQRTFLVLLYEVWVTFWPHWNQWGHFLCLELFFRLFKHKWVTLPGSGLARGGEVQLQSVAGSD